MCPSFTEAHHMSSHTAQSTVSRTSKPQPSAKPKADGIPEALKNFDSLPDSASVRQPVVEALFACSGTTVWRRVKAGLIPKPKKLGSIVAWNVGEIRQALKG